MVKLIRLKSQQDKLLFNNNIQSDLIIKPNSKIALQNVSFEKSVDQIIINESNDKITFDNDTFTADIELSHNTYTTTNFSFFLNDMEIKLNSSLALNEWNLGKQFNVSVSTTNFMTINTATGLQITPATNAGFNKIGVIATGNGDLKKSSTATEGTPDASIGTNTLESFRGYDGCGIFRTEIVSLPAAATAKGFYIGLSKKQQQDFGGTFPLSDMEFAIYCENTSVNYKTVNDGGAVTTHATISPNSSGTDNDFMEIGSHGGKIHLTVYNTANPNGIDLVTAVSYEDDQELYPIIAFFDSVDTNAGDVSYTPYPNANDVLIYSPSALLGATNPVNQNKDSRLMSLVFESQSLAKQLGFQDSFISDNSFNLNWKAVRTVRFFDETECYLVEALNLNFDSYDGSVGQEKRRNLLAVIQNIRDRDQSDVLFDSNSITYIDLNNPQPLPLRNLQFRIINSDEGEVAVNGFSNMTLLLN